MKTQLPHLWNPHKIKIWSINSLRRVASPTSTNFYPPEHYSTDKNIKDNERPLYISLSFRVLLYIYFIMEICPCQLIHSNAGPLTCSDVPTFGELCLCRGICADDDSCPRLHKKWSCPSLHSGIPSRISLCLRRDNCTVVRRYIPSIALSKFHTYSLYILSKRNASQSGTFAMEDIFDLPFDGQIQIPSKLFFHPFC